MIEDTHSGNEMPSEPEAAELLEAEREEALERFAWKPMLEPRWSPAVAVAWMYWSADALERSQEWFQAECRKDGVTPRLMLLSRPLNVLLQQKGDEGNALLKCWETLREALIAGEVIAYGASPNAQSHSSSFDVIPAARWRGLRLDSDVGANQLVEGNEIVYFDWHIDREKFVDWYNSGEAAKLTKVPRRNAKDRHINRIASLFHNDEKLRNMRRDLSAYEVQKEIPELKVDTIKKYIREGIEDGRIPGELAQRTHRKR